MKKFKEVYLDGQERVDAVFADITKGILEDSDQQSGGGNSILPESWLLSDGGVQFVLCKVDRGILLDKSGKSLEKLLGFYSKDNFFLEIWNINVEESYNQLECFVIGYNKNLGYQEVLKDDNSKENVLNKIVKKIEALF